MHTDRSTRLIVPKDTVWSPRALAVYYFFSEGLCGPSNQNYKPVDELHGEILMAYARVAERFGMANASGGEIHRVVTQLKVLNVLERKMGTRWWIFRFVQNVPPPAMSMDDLWKSVSRPRRPAPASSVSAPLPPPDLDDQLCQLEVLLAAIQKNAHIRVNLLCIKITRSARVHLKLLSKQLQPIRRLLSDADAQTVDRLETLLVDLSEMDVGVVNGHAQAQPAETILPGHARGEAETARLS